MKKLLSIILSLAMMGALLVCAIPASADSEAEAVTPITIETINPDGASATLGAQVDWKSPLYSDGELISADSNELLNFSVDLSFKEDLNAPDNRSYFQIYTGNFKFRLKFQRRSFGKTDGTARLQVGVRFDNGTEVGEWFNSNSHHHFRLTAVSTYNEESNITTVTVILYDLEEPLEDGYSVVKQWENQYEGKMDAPLKEVKMWAESNAGHDSNSNTNHAFYLENMMTNGTLDADLNNASYWEIDDDFAIHTYSDYEAVVAVTCGADGTYQRTCSICQAKQTKTVVATGEHQYGEVEIITPAGCLTKGTQQQVCDVCGDVYTKSIKATGHIEATEYTVDVEPTATTVGSKSKHCTVCDAIIESTVEEIPVKSEETTTQEDTTTKAEDPTTKADDTSSKSGCGSTLGVSALALVLVSTLGMGFKRKH